MRGVTFIVDDQIIHSFGTWGLYLAEYPVIGSAEVQSKTVEIPGRDGLLNLSAALDGEIHYYSREISLTFLCIRKWDKWPECYSAIANALHGRQAKIILDDDPGYYYSGSLLVGNPTYATRYWTIPIIGTVDPYKYELLSSTDYEDWLWDDLDLDDGIIRDYNSLPVAGLLELIIPGRRMPVTPVFIVTNIGEDGLVVEYQGKTYELSEGKNTVLDIRLTEGDNLLRFVGSGTVTVEYRGGRL